MSEAKAPLEQGSQTGRRQTHASGHSAKWRHRTGCSRLACEAAVQVQHESASGDALPPARDDWLGIPGLRVTSSA